MVATTGPRTSDVQSADQRSHVCLFRSHAPGSLPLGREAITVAHDLVSALKVGQKNVVDLTACGLTAKEIASVLWISESTVRYHLAEASRRLMLPRQSMSALGYAAHVARCSDCSIGGSDVA